jgi:ADP-ribose pyrophosphatase YjhB (NUDIX family)
LALGTGLAELCLLSAHCGRGDRLGRSGVTRQDQFFASVASRRLVRPAVRAIVRSERGFLVQRPTDDPHAHYAFVGGEYELGDSFEERLRKEFEEETSARVVSAEYLFVVENRFLVKEGLVQTVEHYFEVVLDQAQLVSREPHLEQVWLPEDLFAVADVRPAIVRDALLSADWRSIRHLCVAL